MFLTTHYFGHKINRYLHDHDLPESLLGAIAAKNLSNGAKNVNAWRRKPISEAEIMASPLVNYPLRQYMYCNPNEGAVAVVLCRADRAHEYTDTPIFIRASALRSRNEDTFELLRTSISLPLTPGTTSEAARAAYEEAGIGPDDIELVQQLRGTAGGHQVPGRPRVAVAQLYGAPGSAAVAILST